MGEGVIPQLMPLFENALNQARLRLRLLPHHKEGRRNFFPLENVENLRSPLRIGAVIKSQSDLIRMGSPAMNHRSGLGQRIITGTPTPILHDDHIPMPLFFIQIGCKGITISHIPDRTGRMHRSGQIVGMKPSFP